MMSKRGPKLRRIISEEWTPCLAYAIGLMATDGCLSNDGLLVDLTSKDKEQLKNFSRCLGINYKIGKKGNGTRQGCLRIQFKNRIFYDFLLSVGLTPRKSLTLGKIDIPQKYFYDFLRGCFDGDGSFYSYWDKRWRSSHMFYLSFVSASEKHIKWLRSEIKDKEKVSGHITFTKKGNGYFQLKYAKKEAMVIIKKMYYNSTVVCLSRKRVKILRAFAVEERQQKLYF